MTIYSTNTVSAQYLAAPQKPEAENPNTADPEPP